MLASDTRIDFGTRPGDETGWVTAKHPNGDLDTASITIETNRDILMTWQLGSDFHHIGLATKMPLEFAARAEGEGEWVCGGQFHTYGGNFTPWTDWEEASDRHPYTGSVQFDEDQVFTLQIKARAKRDGLADPAGSYDQPQELTITFAALND